MNPPKLTEKEIKAIKALRRLEMIWPKSLQLFGMSILSVVKADAIGNQWEIASTPGIPCDGGEGDNIIGGHGSARIYETHADHKMERNGRYANDVIDFDPMEHYGL